MNWEDEKYIKLYTRDTVSYKLLPWQGRCLLPLIMRKLDRAGVMDIGKYSPAEAVSVMVDVPIDVTKVGIEALLQSGIFELGNQSIFCPNYLDAQSATQSDKARQKASRERRRDVTKRDNMSQNVTEPSQSVTTCHELSQPVTPRLDQTRLEETNLKKKSKKKKEIPEEVIEIFTVWQQVHNHPKAKLDAKREAKITERLKEGYSTADLCDAIRGAKYDPWLQGGNPDGKVYTNLQTILREAATVDRHLETWEQHKAEQQYQEMQAQEKEALEECERMTKQHGRDSNEYKQASEKYQSIRLQRASIKPIAEC